MLFTHSFSVPASAQRTWRFLRNAELVARCLPGADLESADGDRLTGTFTVLMGPLRLNYYGQAQFIAVDEERAVTIEARGALPHAGGTAKARIDIRLAEKGRDTVVTVDADLVVAGFGAQTAGPVLADATRSVVDQLARCLRDEVGADPVPDADLPGPSRRRRGRPLRAALVAVAVLLVASAAFVAGRATAPRDDPPAVYLDDEYDFLGALSTWPAAPGSSATDPFQGQAPERLVAAGRTVCTRAGDPGMDAYGMADLLGFDPHQTFVIVTESVDKLCPSQRDRLPVLTAGPRE